MAVGALRDDVEMGALVRRGLEVGFVTVRPALEAVWLAAGQRPMRRGHLLRSGLHAGMGLMVIGLVHALPSVEAMRLVATVATLLAWAVEGARSVLPGVNGLMMRVFGRTAHAHEVAEVNSATWYTTAMCVLSWTVSPQAATVGIAVLAFGDPAAALVGRRFGRIRLVGRRTLEGALTMTTVGTAFAALTLLTWGIPMGAAVGLGAVAGTAGAAAEVGSLRVDDNLAIPVVAAFATAWLGL